MSSVTDTFGSHHEVMEALHQNFAGNDDAQKAIKVDKLRDDMAAACRLREDDIKTTISELSRHVEETQEAATRLEAPEAHFQRVHRLSSSTQQTKENVNSLNKAARGLESQREACKSAGLQLQSRGQQVQELATISEPHARHELALYAHISKLSWQGKDLQKWSGTVSDSAAGDIRTVDLDTQQLSNFDMINKVWDNIDPPQDKEQTLLLDT
ncbi:hypothetical protein WJX82_010402 [Trebouxia sp. C0006]